MSTQVSITSTEISSSSAENRRFQERKFNYTLLLVLIIFTAACSSKSDVTSVQPPPPAPVEEESLLEWHDVAELEMEGKGWPEEQAPFRRLPDRAKDQVTEAVWGLSRHTAGLALRFTTDSPEVHARWSGGGAMGHMPATGVSGLDLYRRNHDGLTEWSFAGVGKPLPQTTERNLTSDFLLPEDYEPGTEAEYLLFLPLYAPVNELKIGLNPGSTFQVLKDSHKPIVMYGTSIVQGGCASRTGMSHAAILRRWLDREVINLGFSGAGKMELEMADLISEIDASIYVIDCLPNMTLEMTEERLKPFLERLSEKKPDTPVLLVEHHLAFADERNAFLEETYSQFKATHPAPVGYIHREKFEGIENGYVDGIHPTDLGFLKMAEAMVRPIGQLINEK